MHQVQVSAAPHQVWPWIAQMMRGGGIYGWQRLEAGWCRSSDRLLETVPQPRVGDRVGEVFEVIEVDVEHKLTWRSCDGLEVLGLPVDDVTISYELGGDGEAPATLTARARCGCRQLTAPLRRHVLRIIDRALTSRQIQTLKRLIEQPAPRADSRADPPRQDIQYQAASFHPMRGMPLCNRCEHRGWAALRDPDAPPTPR